MKQRSEKKARAGFTIMELLVVMSIMGILTAIGVTSYFSAISGMTRRSAVSHFVAALNQAHQLASVEASKVGVIWYNESKDGSTTNAVPTYVIVRAVGTVSLVNGARELYDEFTPLDERYGIEESTENYSKFKGIRIYNMSYTGDGYADVYPRVRRHTGLRLQSPYYELIKGNYGFRDPLSAGSLYIYPYGFRVKTANSNWQSGDPYGLAVSEPMMLPKNIIFSSLGTQTTSGSGLSDRSVWFYPDGHSDSRSVTLKDTQQSKSCSIKINNDGSITYGSW